MDQFKNISFSGNTLKPIKGNVTNVIRNYGYVENENNNIKHVENVSIEDLTKEEIISELEKRFKDEADKQKWVADDLASSLSDTGNLNYYRSIVSKYPADFLFECRSIAKDALRDGIVRTTVAKFFVGVVKRNLEKERR